MPTGSGEHARPETTAAEILKQTGAAGKDTLKQLSATQAAGMKLAWAVGSAIAVVILFVCIDWLMITPRIHPSLHASREVIDNYQDMRGYAIDDASRLFDLVVAKALLPVFTAILGYIFGSREAAARMEEED